MAGRILIVDDEADMLLLLKRIISEETEHTFSTALRLTWSSPI